MRIAAFACCLLLAGCARTPSLAQADAAEIERAAAAILAIKGTTAIPEQTWPVEIRALSPKTVRIDADGLYVTTSSWFVDEAGIFVPRRPETFPAVLGGDPEYRRLHGAVFSYRIRG